MDSNETSDNRYCCHPAKVLNMDTEKKVSMPSVELNEMKRQMLVQKKEIQRLKQVQHFMELQRNTTR
ncbi:hypothetical protein KDRO_B04500 [Kluyveromyces lactis]|nr:hypothetical protein KDRO_B04500 [Kluyveromyces lactis]